MAAESPFTLPEHVVLSGTARLLRTKADFGRALVDAGGIDETRDLRLHYAFGGTSRLGVFEEAARLAYRALEREHLARLPGSQLLVVDGATRAGHILLVEEMIGALRGMASDSNGRVGSVGITSAAALRDDVLPGLVSSRAGSASSGTPLEAAAGQHRLFNEAHGTLLVVDTPERDAGWGFETPFFMESMRLVCHKFRSSNALGKISISATFVNGGEVSAKEFVYSSIMLPYLTRRYGAETEIVLASGSGRVADQLARACVERMPVEVHLHASGSLELVAEVRFGEGEVTSRIVSRGAGQARDDSEAANHLYCNHPLCAAEQERLTALAASEVDGRCKLRVV